MRVFETLEEAGREIRREIYKSPRVDVTRVQHMENLEIQARERLGFTYSVAGGWPETPRELVELAQKLDLTTWSQSDPKLDVEAWLTQELRARFDPMITVWDGVPNEVNHYALSKTIEGSWPSYTYQERLYGAIDAMALTLVHNPDSRRAYWPIFRPEDSLRAMAPTRVPCSLGYEALIRKVGSANHLIMFYLMRSADYDTFWLSDIWLARQLQLLVVDAVNQFRPELEVVAGQVVHHIISFHSFFAAGSEVY